jgi:heterodisulfide reductase subunit A
MKGLYDTLVIGAGMAGMEASLNLARAGKKVCLVEKLSLIGGNVIKFEESFPHLECSTCMVSPVQQEILQHPNIDVMMLSTVKKVEGEVGSFQVIIHKTPRYVSLETCIGCGLCYEPCPVSLKNAWEENLSEKKAIYVPCPGALPNVPVIDSEHCIQLSGKKSCKACQEACMFGAIDFSEREEELEIQAATIVVSTGFELLDVSRYSHLGYGKLSAVYTAMEFERLFASNGPTSGELILRTGEKSIKSVAVVHCVGRKDQRYCSGVCCLSAFKHAHFVKHKLPDAKVYDFHSDLCMPGKTSEKFYMKVKEEGVDFIFQSDPEKIKIAEDGQDLEITYRNTNGKEKTIRVDMVILGSAMIPSKSTPQLAKILDIDRDDWGFFRISDKKLGSTESSRKGIFIAGCAEGPKDAQSSVVQAESAVAGVMHCLSSVSEGAVVE